METRDHRRGRHRHRGGFGGRHRWQGGFRGRGWGQGWGWGRGRVVRDGGRGCVAIGARRHRRQKAYTVPLRHPEALHRQRPEPARDHGQRLDRQADRSLIVLEGEEIVEAGRAGLRARGRKRPDVKPGHGFCLVGRCPEGAFGIDLAIRALMMTRDVRRIVHAIARRPEDQAAIGHGNPHPPPGRSRWIGLIIGAGIRDGLHLFRRVSRGLGRFSLGGRRLVRKGGRRQHQGKQQQRGAPQPAAIDCLVPGGGSHAVDPMSPHARLCRKGRTAAKDDTRLLPKSEDPATETPAPGRRGGEPVHQSGDIR
ncbi:MAG TPA: hypothetical protein DCK97_22805 [Tistrella mobilis]|uniref:Uncharacterized protein n=1 Tax=Tistrella mobilis TaxID=171437 RepID=A0A3B9IR51_9PROT|nr:hypothetical protein [Tistrella mobilis]